MLSCGRPLAEFGPKGQFNGERPANAQRPTRLGKDLRVSKALGKPVLLKKLLKKCYITTNHQRTQNHYPGNNLSNSPTNFIYLFIDSNDRHEREPLTDDNKEIFKTACKKHSSLFFIRSKQQTAPCTHSQCVDHDFRGVHAFRPSANICRRCCSRRRGINQSCYRHDQCAHGPSICRLDRMSSCSSLPGKGATSLVDASACACHIPTCERRLWLKSISGQWASSPEALENTGEKSQC